MWELLWICRLRYLRALSVRSTIQLAPQLLQVLQDVRGCVRLRTGNGGSCRVSEYWPGREGASGFEAANKLATVRSRHATLVWTNGNDSYSLSLITILRYARDQSRISKTYWQYLESFEEHHRKRAAEKPVIFQSWTGSREALHTHTHIHGSGWETFRKSGYEKWYFLHRLNRLTHQNM